MANHMIRPPEARFWSKVSINPHPLGCREWTGRLVKGYGTIRVGRKHMGAHRFSYELANGPIPPGLCVCHRCDNPACVNPDHLFVGSHADNSADKMAKGRGAVASRNGRAKFTDDQVRAIRDLYRAGGITQAEIANRYGVARSTITVIVSGRFWKSVA